MCDFEYREKIYVWNVDEAQGWYAEFLAHQPEADFPFIVKSPFGHIHKTIMQMRYARRPLPDIKPGHPIMVCCGGDDDTWWVVWFKKFSGKFLESNSGSFYPKWKLLPNYDYTQEPPIKVEVSND